MLFCKKNKSKESFDVFLNHISNIADSFMLKQAKKTGINYTGGECVIAIPSGKSKIVTTIEIYGVLKNEKWKKSSLVLQRPLKSFSDDAETQTKLEEIKNTPLKFKVAPPDREV